MQAEQLAGRAVVGFGGLQQSHLLFELPGGPLGVALAAERSGKIAVGDKLSRVNGRSTAGLGYEAVLGMVREATRPVTIHFERKGTHDAGVPVERVAHQDWR